MAEVVEKAVGKDEAPPAAADGMRRPKILLLAIVIAVIAALILAAFWTGWIGKKGTPHVFITGFQASITDFPDCTATFNYILHNDGTAKAYVDIDYLDDGWVVAHDFYVVDAGAVKYVDYSIFHVACTGHNYSARVAAVS